MHYHLEVIMPPTDNVDAVIKTIMEPFSENNDEASHTFWDWYVIGGRYAGSKVEAKLDKERMDAFYAELDKRKVTVSGLQWGKQELSPASQVPEVDALWREMFPDSGMDVCPMFLHSNRNKGTLLGDICTLSECPKELSAFRVIIACPYDNEIEAQYMVAKDIWNGVMHEDTTFGGNVLWCVSNFLEKSKNYSGEFRAKSTPQDNWLVVTVDYHS